MVSRGERCWPVSVKGVLIRGGRVLLLQNHRGEWELPGGRLDDGESPEEALVREIREETGLTAAVVRLVDAWVYPVVPGKAVLILAYTCRVRKGGRLCTSAEHRLGTWMRLDRLESEPLPPGYVRTIRRAASARGKP